MLIKKAALKTHLKQTLSPCYCLCGTDLYQRHEARLWIKQQHDQHHTTSERLFFSLETLADWHHLFQEARQYDLFSSSKWIEAHYTKKTLDTATAKLITDYLKSSEPSVTMVIEMPHLASKQAQSLLKEAIIIPIYPLTSDEFKRWLSKSLSEQGFQYNNELIDVIENRTQGSAFLSQQCIEKLRLTHHDTSIPLTASSIDTHLKTGAHYTLQAFSEAYLSGNFHEAKQCLQGLIHQKTDLMLLLWIITEDLRKLIALKTHLNEQPAQLAARLKIWPSHLRLYQKASSRFSITQLYDHLKQTQTLDEIIKSAHASMIVLHLERLIYQMKS